MALPPDGVLVAFYQTVRPPPRPLTAAAVAGIVVGRRLPWACHVVSILARGGLPDSPAAPPCPAASTTSQKLLTLLLHAVQDIRPSNQETWFSSSLIYSMCYRQDARHAPPESSLLGLDVLIRFDDHSGRHRPLVAAQAHIGHVDPQWAEDGGDRASLELPVSNRWWRVCGPPAVVSRRLVICMSARNASPA